MNVKKLAIIGVVALIVIGCVLAAGCTSSTNTSATDNSTAKTTVVTNGVVGNWELDSEVMLQMMKELALAFGATEEEINLDELRAQIPKNIFQFNSDGTGKITLVGEEGAESGFTWKSLGNNKFTLSADGIDYELTLSPEKGILTDSTGSLSLKKVAA